MKNQLESLLKEYSESFQKLLIELQDCERWINELEGRDDPYYEPHIRAAEIESARYKERMAAADENVKAVQSRLTHYECKLDCDEKWKYNGGYLDD